MIPFLKSIPDKKTFNDNRDKLPSDVYENFSWIAEGFDPQEIIDMIKADTSDTEQEESDKANTPPITDDFSVALKNSESKKSFVVIEGEEELRRIMAEPLEKWRVFLHPTQRKIVKKNYNGSARVLGGAGTGKTVVAMHRAKYLASKLGDDERILFTTFTANLAENIKSNLRKICSLDELQKIEVINLDACGITLHLRPLKVASLFTLWSVLLCFDRCLIQLISYNFQPLLLISNIVAGIRMANKKNPDRINKELMIRVRVTKEEHEKFTKKAEENGYKSVSDYVRTLIADVNDTENEVEKK